MKRKNFLVLIGGILTAPFIISEVPSKSEPVNPKLYRTKIGKRKVNGCVSDGFVEQLKRMQDRHNAEFMRRHL